MKKSAITLFLVVSAVTVFAQNIQEGINHWYAERYASAKSTFEKMLASNPNNIEAIYWLGQTHIANDDVAAARALYQRSLSSTNNAPLIRVGMGHVLLLEGKPQEARQEFEAAITASRGRKGDDPNILNAIGRANVDAYNERDKRGDLDYAIAKLTQAAQAAPNNADIFLNLGNAYRKKHEGGQAATNYMKAAQLNPNFAAPYYQLARLYKTQRNWDVVATNLDKAIKADPKFAPAYYQQYDYNLRWKQDFAAAENVANQYIANADPSPQNDYLKAQTLFLQKKYDEAIRIGQNILNQSGNKARPSVYRLLAYSNLEKGDTAAARPYVDQFFANIKDEDDIVPLDYLLRAYVYFKEDPSIVRTAIQEGVKADTILKNQVDFLNEVVDLARKQNNRLLEADARLIRYQLLGERANPNELFYIGIPYYQAGQFQRADSVFRAYTAAMPDSIYGYLWSARSLGSMDTSMTQGTAIEAYKQLLEAASRDTVRFKSQGVEAAGYLATYYNNIKGDKATAITYLQRGLEIDPDNTALQNTIKVLQRPATPRKATGTTPTKTKTKTETGKTKTKTKPA